MTTKPRRGEMVLPDAGAAIEPWQHNPETHEVTVAREAEHWTAHRGGKVSCQLCYRACFLKPGERGWCGYRSNHNGRMELGEHAHGVISAAVRQQRGYQVDPFLTYKPGATSLFIGATHCTAGCVFCMSKEITWQPSRVPWVDGRPMRVAMDGALYGHRSVMHPEGVIALAQQWGCQQVEFGINEPLLSWEYTFDIARLAKAAGLDVVVETNGFSGRGPIERLAEYVSAVDVGAKLHLDEAMYGRRMRSAGAPEAVKESIKAWHEAGVHLIIGDLIPPPHWCTDAEADEAARRFYDWVASEVDPHVPVLITRIMVPGPQEEGKGGLLLRRGATAADEHAVARRHTRALRIAKQAGLAYAHTKNADPIRCHNCGGVLLQFPDPCLHCNPCTMPTSFCHFWTHEQHVTDGHCDHCNAAVPIVTLSQAELDQTARLVGPLSRRAESTRHHVTITEKGERWIPLRPV